MPGKLYLIPSFLGYHPLGVSHPEEVLKQVRLIEHFAVEKLQTAVQFLNKCDHPVPEFKLQFHPLDKHVTGLQLNDIVQVLQSGKDVGVLPEAGCPGIADPGADLVWLCHRRGIEVIPLVGPSAILLSVMAAGLNGQNFAFNGYLPMQRELREQKIREHQNRSLREQQAQAYIESPNRNSELLKSFMDILGNEARLSVSWNLLNEDQWIRSAEAGQWRSIALPENFDKKPAMFVFQAQASENNPPQTDPRKKNKARRK